MTQDSPTSNQHGYGPLDTCGRRIGDRCNHIDPERCCGGGYDAPCGCTECHPTAEMPSNPGNACTHSEGCYAQGAYHYACALTEIERLREALEDIAHHEIPMGVSKPMPTVAHDECRRIARQALAGSSSEPEKGHG